MNYEEYQIELAVAVAFAVAVIGTLVLGFQSLLLDLAIAGIGIWTVYRAFGGLVYGWARHAWKEAAETLDLEFREPRIGEIPESSTFSDGLAYFIMFLANSRRDFELSGTVGGESVEVRAESTDYGRSTVSRVDFADEIPDWLRVRKGASAAGVKSWMKPRDIPVGDRTFDERFLVQGPDADAIRAFFDAHPITDLLVELGRQFAEVAIEDGKLRVVRPTVLDEASELVEEVERLGDTAAQMRERFEGAETVADFEEEETVEKAADEPVHASSG